MALSPHQDTISQFKLSHCALSLLQIEAQQAVCAERCSPITVPAVRKGPKNMKTYCWNMFGWLGEVGGTRKNHTRRCLWSLNYLAERKASKTTKIIFLVFNISNSSPIFLFCPRNPESDFLGKYKKTRARKWSRSVLSKFNLEPYDAIWCKFGSQFSSTKTKNSS